MPDALRDPDNPRQPWASSAVKEKLVEFACRDEYSSDVPAVDHPRLLWRCASRPRQNIGPVEGGADVKQPR